MSVNLSAGPIASLILVSFFLIRGPTIERRCSNRSVVIRVYLQVDNQLNQHILQSYIFYIVTGRFAYGSFRLRLESIRLRLNECNTIKHDR